MKKLLLTFALVLANSVWAADSILWLKLDSILSYRDLSVFCTTEQSPKTLYFSAETSNGKVKRAYLRTDISSLGSWTELSAEEFKTTELTESSDERVWIKQIQFGPKTLHWLLFNISGGSFMGCKPTQPLQTLSPQSVTYHFDLSTVLLLPSSAVSSTGKLNGQLKNQDGYQAEIYFVQRQAR